MHHRVPRLHGAFFKLRTLFSEELIALLLVLFVFAVPVGATTRFENRSLFMYDVAPGATTEYKFSLDYMTVESMGSLNLLFCESPIPHDPCVTPAGLDVSNATLSEQTGEAGFAISQKTANRIVLSRTPSMIAGPGSKSTYSFKNIKNPTDQTKAFSVRINNYGSTTATGPFIDFGSVRGSVGEGLIIQTQVPPMLIFCVAGEVEQDCSETNDNFFTDMGDMSDRQALTAQSQMAIGTNASAGFAITVTGNSLTAGTNVVNELTAPAASIPGRNQFGINLVENSDLGVGRNPEGPWTNAVPSPEYGQSNMFTYNSGDVIAYSPNVSLMRKFTVSYLVNVSPSLRAGVYTTTINYVASGRF